MADAMKIETRATSERLSVEEIERRYPNEWVVLVDTNWTKTNMKTTEGVVYAHNPRKKEAYDMARALPSAAIFWTGKIQSPAR